MNHLTDDDLQRWVRAIVELPRNPNDILSWIGGSLREFFHFDKLILGCGELVAGQLKITHMIAVDHEESYIKQIQMTFDLDLRGSLKWWLSTRQPFFIDPSMPPSYASTYELEEVRDFGLGNVAGHGVLNIKSNAGSYFGFTSVRSPLSDWHREALKVIAPVLNDLLVSHFSFTQFHHTSVFEKLTKRQSEIVRHVAEGVSDKSIARILGISEKTVRNQLVEVFKKLDFHKRTELIAYLR